MKTKKKAAASSGNKKSYVTWMPAERWARVNRVLEEGESANNLINKAIETEIKKREKANVK